MSSPWRRETRTLTLLEQARTDPQAFAEFFDCYSKRVLIFLTRRLLDPEVALDLTSETFATALSKVRQFRGHSAEEEQAWLFRLARTQLSRYWRSGVIERRALERFGIETPPMTLWEIERIEELSSVRQRAAGLLDELAQLPFEQQTAIRMRIIEELDYETIAARTGVSPDAVRARVSRGLRRLAETARHVDTADVA